LLGSWEGTTQSGVKIKLYIGSLEPNGDIVYSSLIPTPFRRRCERKGVGSFNIVFVV